MRELTIKGIIGFNLKLGENPHKSPKDYNRSVEVLPRTDESL